MKTCGCRPPLASGRRRSSRVLARAFGEVSSPVEGVSSSGRSVPLTCSDRNGLMRLGSWLANRGPFLVAHERRQRVRFGGATASRQGSGALPPPRAQAREWQPIGPKPATRRQARSRWRPDDRKVVRRRDRTAKRIAPGAQKASDSKAISKSNAGGFPTVDRRAVSRGDVSTWVLVTRNVGCRNGFEASWRCVQGKAARPHEAQSRAMAQGPAPCAGRRV